ncbi:MAG: hypothetical protein JW751_24900 [Polyangiaceae bacterium]|nr:hypothetical protein [Polyangiaceae bacterium]
MYPVAQAALLLMVPVTAILFAVLRPNRAAILVLLAGFLVLPEAVSFDAPVLPAFDRTSLPPLLAYFGLAVTAPQRLSFRPHRSLCDLLLCLTLVGVLLSGLANPDPLQYGPRFLPGVGVTDAASAFLRKTLDCALPYLVGKACVRDSRDLREMVEVVVIAAVLYFPLMAFELRMSPQLHRMVYGFEAEGFIHSMRAGGYRPVVFTPHGLALAIFIAATTIFAWALPRVREGVLRPWAWYIVALESVALVLMKSLAPLLYALVFVPLLLWSRRRLLIAAVVAASVIVLTYPSSRASGAFPTELVLDLAGKYSEQRADSQETRFINEDILLAKARQRPALGWGPMGRNRSYNEYGEDYVITDGAWIIIIGCYGYVGFLLFFGFCVSCLVTGLQAVRRLPLSKSVLLGALLAVATSYVVDQVPNADPSYLSVFFLGCLVGAAAGLRREHREHRRSAGPGALPRRTPARVRATAR